MVKIPISPTNTVTTPMIREKFLTRGNIFVIALGFILILLVPVSHANHKGRYSPSHSMKGTIVIDNPDQLLAGSSVQFIYIIAFNCPDCEDFYDEEFAELKKSQLASKIYITIISTEDYGDPGASSNRYGDAWPTYLKWIPDKAALESCGPQYLVMIGRNILHRACGSYNFNKAKLLLNSLANCPIPKLRSSYANVSSADQYKIPQECFVILSEEKVKQIRMNYKKQ